MVKRIGSIMRKSRQKLTKSIREKSKLNIRRFLQTLNEGDKVALKADSAYQRGMYNLRFHGKTGTVVGTSGKCYMVKVKDVTNYKTVVVHPIHLKKV